MAVLGIVRKDTLTGDDVRSEIFHSPVSALSSALSRSVSHGASLLAIVIEM